VQASLSLEHWLQGCPAFRLQILGRSDLPLSVLHNDPVDRAGDPIHVADSAMIRRGVALGGSCGSNRQAALFVAHAVAELTDSIHVPVSSTRLGCRRRRRPHTPCTRQPLPTDGRTLSKTLSLLRAPLRPIAARISHCNDFADHCPSNADRCRRDRPSGPSPGILFAVESKVAGRPASYSHFDIYISSKQHLASEH